MASELLDELAQVIGQQAVTRLCETMGGTRVYVPAAIAHSHPIAAAIGLKAAAALADHYHGTTVDLPKAHLRRARVIEFARSGRMTIAEAARACDYTERRVYQLLARERGNDQQLDLFAKRSA